MMKISIALATYNGEKYLQALLDSFALQTRLPDELIVGDDGSSYNSVEILRKFELLKLFDAKIHINDKNIGYTRIFEKAISICSGDVSS